MNTLSLYTIHEYNENHKIIKGIIADFLSIKEKIYNWEYNRPPDISRVTEIAKWIYRKNAPLDWIFYMIYDNEKQKYNIIQHIIYISNYEHFEIRQKIQCMHIFES